MSPTNYVALFPCPGCGLMVYTGISSTTGDMPHYCGGTIRVYSNEQPQIYKSNNVKLQNNKLFDKYKKRLK